MAWDDDKRAKAVEMYLALSPTPENSVECVTEVAKELEESPNGVRSILTKQGAYIKKTPATKASSGEAKEGGTKRVGKAEQQKALIDAINDSGQEADTDIIDKLSGKAAAYLAGVIGKIVNGNDAD